RATLLIRAALLSRFSRAEKESARNNFLAEENYFWRKKISTGTPSKSKCSRSLFSIKRLYGSFTYCGRLQKKANIGERPLICVAYLILINFPLVAGGGKF